MKQNRLKLWEVALLLGLALAMITGAWAEDVQTRLAGEVLRLHVIANSDSGEDQALKLLVRDEVLSVSADLLEGCSSRAQAIETLSSATETLQAVAEKVIAEQGSTDPVTVTLEETWFPTKEYDGFALPPGQYTALRVVIGSGQGKNWWCVVFPPLCLASSVETAEEALASGVSQEDVALMTGADEGYSLQFKTVELWEQLTRPFRQ
jgi:stage II sporulation protein R